jgi:hypothetical protein
MEGFPFIRFDHLEFGFPITKHVRFKPCPPANLSDPVIEPVRVERALIFVI